MIVIIFPDKTAFIPVFRDYLISQHFSVLIFCIKIKNKNTLRIQIIIDQTEYFLQFILFCHIIDTITDTDYCSHSSVQFKLLHILQQIKDIMATLNPFLHGNLQHIFGIIYSDHIIPFFSQEFCHTSGPASQFQNQSVFYSVFF